MNKSKSTVGKPSWWVRKVVLSLGLRHEFYKSLELEFAAAGDVPGGLESFILELEGLFAKKRREIFSKILDRVANGESLNSAVGMLFPADEKLFLEALWTSSNKKEAFRLLAARCGRKRKTNFSTFLKFVPGLLVSVIAVGVFYFVGSQLRDAVERVEVPVALDTVEQFAIWFSSQSIPVLIGMGTIPLWVIGLVVWSMANWAGPSRRIFDNFGPWRLYREAVGSALLVNISEMHRAGIPFKDALWTLSGDASPWLRGKLLAAYHAVTVGEKLGNALRMSGTALPNEKILRYLKKIENTQDFSENLEEVIATNASQVEEETTAKVSTYAFMLMMTSLGLIAAMFPLIFSVTRVTKIGMQSHLF